MTTNERMPKAKPGELIMRWGKVDNEKPCVCFSWGEGVSQRDTLLLCSVLAKLEDRGYDLTTLRFSVRKGRDANLCVEGESSYIPVKPDGKTTENL